MTDEERLRPQIVEEALSWECTPYHPCAAIKGVGVDCAMLPVAVFSELGVIPHLSPQYSSQWMNHRDEEKYLAEIRRWAREVPMTEVRPGDLIVWKFGRVFSHSAIVVEYPVVIHAAIRGHMVFRCDIDQDEDYKAETRPRLAFSVFNPDGSLYRSAE